MQAAVCLREQKVSLMHILLGPLGLDPGSSRWQGISGKLFN